MKTEFPFVKEVTLKAKLVIQKVLESTTIGTNTENLVKFHKTQLQHENGKTEEISIKPKLKMMTVQSSLTTGKKITPMKKFEKKFKIELSGLLQLGLNVDPNQSIT